MGALASGLLAAATAAGANPQSDASPKPARGASPEATTVEVINGTAREIKNFSAPPTGALRSHAGTAADQTRVEVINGTAQRTVVLAAQPSIENKAATVHPGRPRYRGRKAQADNAPWVTTEILNGTTRETRVFRAPAGGADSIAHNLHPVVIGVASSGSKNQSGAYEPVVIGIAGSGSKTEGTPGQPVVLRVISSGSQSQTGTTEPVVVGVESSGIANAGSDGEPVAIAVSPHPPKRPPYRRPTPSP
jgi:hypothetical protein